MVANIFEFNECIEVCCEELKRGLDRDNAIGVIGAFSSIETPPKAISDVIDAAVVAMGRLENMCSQGGFESVSLMAVRKPAMTRIKVG